MLEVVWSALSELMVSSEGRTLAGCNLYGQGRESGVKGNGDSQFINKSRKYEKKILIKNVEKRQL